MICLRRLPATCLSSVYASSRSFSGVPLRVPDNELLQRIDALCGSKRLKQAVECLEEIENFCVRKRFRVYARLLDACFDHDAPSEGKLVHTHMKETGFPSCLFLNNRLLGVYVKSGSLDDARDLLDKMPEQDAYSWNTLMSGYVNRGLFENALKVFDEMPERNHVSWAVIIRGCVKERLFSDAILLFQRMCRSGSPPDYVIYTEVLRASAGGGLFEGGLQLHCLVMKVGVYMEELVRNTALDMYAKCGDMTSARRMFDEMPEPDSVSFNCLIAGYVMRSYVMGMDHAL